MLFGIPTFIITTVQNTYCIVNSLSVGDGLSLSLFCFPVRPNLFDKK